MAEKKKSLFEINADILAVAEQLDSLVVIDGQYVNPETGEVFALDVLDQLGVEKEDKMKSCIYVYKRFDQQIAGIEGQIKYVQQQLDALKERKKSIENRKKRFGEYMILCTKGEKWAPEDKSCSCYTKKNESTNITDENAVPDKFATVEMVRTVDKNEVKKAIKAGETVPGASISVSYTFIAR